jgi:NAD(P)-dependent dehydrogenase (short-subunit alcohol dehydrogenase family)
MRERKSGTVVFIGSLVGWTGIPNCGIYAASKFAIRGRSLDPVAYHPLSISGVEPSIQGIAMTLHDEIAPLGLRSVCIDPGQFRTAFLAAENRSPWIPRIDAYRPMSANVEAIFNGVCLQILTFTSKFLPITVSFLITFMVFSVSREPTRQPCESG